MPRSSRARRSSRSRFTARAWRSRASATCSARSTAAAITPAGRSDRARSKATTSCARGTSGASTAVEGHGERGFEQDVVPAYGVRVRGGRVQVSVTPHVKRQRKQHTPHPLAREPRARSRAGARGRHLDHRDERGLSALLDLRRAARGGARARARSSAAGRSGSACASSRSATARATTRRRRAPAPGPARSRRWIRTISSTASTRRSCTGPTSS